MEEASEIYYNLLKKSLDIPGARVDREGFLKKNLQKYCLTEQIDNAVTTSVFNAEIPEDVLEKIARSIIKKHTLQVTGISTITGMPGGLAMVATIPADLAQYYYHVIVLAQKLAFLYGYPRFDGKVQDVGDEKLIHNLTLFLGVMYEVDGAKNAVLEVSGNPNEYTLSKVPGQTLTETANYILKKNIARWIGIKVTKKTFSQSLSKAIPLVSGFVSGGISYISFTPMAENLRVTLKEGYQLKLTKSV